MKLELTLSICENLDIKSYLHEAEAALQRCSQEKVIWKYAANLKKKTHAEVWFQ